MKSTFMIQDNIPQYSGLNNIKAIPVKGHFLSLGLPKSKIVWNMNFHVK